MERPRNKMRKQDDQINRAVEFFSKSAEKDFYSLPSREVIITFITQLEGRLAINLTPTILFTNLGDGVIQLKINGSPAYRCVYTMKQPGKVIVLHTFVKTTNGPDVKNVQLANKRAKKL